MSIIKVINAIYFLCLEVFFPLILRCTDISSSIDKDDIDTYQWFMVIPLIFQEADQMQYTNFVFICWGQLISFSGNKHIALAQACLAKQIILWVNML